jgi:hypothetical protein
VAGAPTGVGADGLTAPDGYEILGIRVELTGICPDCQVRVPEDRINLLRENTRNNH